MGNVVLESAALQSDSVIHIYIFFFLFHILFHFRLFSSVTKLCPALCGPWTAARQAFLSFTIPG